MSNTTKTTNPRSRIAWRNAVNLANNAAFIGFEGGTMVFDATPFAAKGIVNMISKAYRYNKLTLTIRSKANHGNVYTLKVNMIVL